jgi:hypothetical protein
MIAMAGLGLGATALGGVLGAAGSIFGGMAQSSAYSYQAQVAQINAQVAKQNANAAIAAGESKAEITGMKTKAQIGQTVATQGASGLEVGAGTGQKVVQSEQQEGLFEQDTDRYNAAKAAYGDEVTAVSDINQANLFSSAATNSMTSGIIGAGTSILGATGSFASKWSAGQQAFGSNFNPFGTV